MMTFSHQPGDYACPFCSIVAGHDNEGDWTKQTDVVLRDTLVTAFLAANWWAANHGQVLVVPNGHYENVYSIPDEALAAVQIAGKRIAIAIRSTYGCDGTSFRQHNEPAGNQDVWHYHLHVFPRYQGDDLYLKRGRERRLMTPAERLPYVQKLRKYLATQP
jgi:histidine triad (HIT) family protein